MQERNSHKGGEERREMVPPTKGELAKEEEPTRRERKNKKERGAPRREL